MIGCVRFADRAMQINVGPDMSLERARPHSRVLKEGQCCFGPMGLESLCKAKPACVAVAQLEVAYEIRCRQPLVG